MRKINFLLFFAITVADGLRQRKCLKAIHVKNEGFQDLILSSDCLTRIRKSPDIALQMTCKSVTKMNYCPGKLMQIANDEYCILQQNEGTLDNLKKVFVPETVIDIHVQDVTGNGDDTKCTLVARSFRARFLDFDALFDLFEGTSNCGQVKEIPSKNQAKIVGGNEARAHNYNWMVPLVIRKNGKTLLCGGSIVSENKILTAAHCTENASSITAYYGAHKLTQASLRANMKSFVIHDKFEFPNYDTSIITLDRKLTFSDTVGPVCLPNILSKGSENHQEMVGLGWGRTENNKISNVLKENFFNIITDEECKNIFGNVIKDEAIICTKDVIGQSVCQGDSGSSLGAFENGKFVQYGVISFTANTCYEGFPAGYSELETQMDWIRKHL